jgi:hypothetical protein
MMAVENNTFQHPLLATMLDPPSDQELRDLVARTLVGDTYARHTLIRHLMTVARKCIGMILSVYPSRYNDMDDMVSEASLAIVDLVERIANGDSPAPSDRLFSYAAVMILRQVNEMLITSVVIPIPDASYRRNWRQGREQPIRYTDLQLDTLPVTNNPENEVDIRDAFDVIVSTPIEKKILELRESGYSDADIGQVVGVSRQTITLLRLNLYRRYLDATK